MSLDGDDRNPLVEDYVVLTADDTMSITSEKIVGADEGAILPISTSRSTRLTDKSNQSWKSTCRHCLISKFSQQDTVTGI